MNNFRPWKPNDIPIKTVEEKELEYLVYNGPVLMTLTESTGECPFRKNTSKNTLFPEVIRQPELQDQIVIRTNDLSNIRAFYFMLLSTCFSSHLHDIRLDQRVSQLIRGFKSYVYAESTSLDTFGRQYNQQQYKKILQSNRSMKKLIAQALQLLSVSHTEDVFSLLKKYPILDIIFVCVIRALVVCHHHYLPQLKSISKGISSDIIVNSFRAQFGARIEYTPFGEMVFEDNIVMKEEKGYTHLRKLTESMIESTNCKRTSESSDGNGFVGNILDISKSMAGSMIEAKTKEDPQIQPIEQQSPKKIKCLSAVRRCDSICAGHDSDKQKIADFKQKTSRDSPQGNRIREAHSEMDDDSNDSSASCVIYKVEFGQTPNFKMPSPRAPAKPISPVKPTQKQSKFGYPSNINYRNPPVEEFKLKPNDCQPPTIKVQSAPQLQKPKQTTVSSKLYTIPSVDDSCIQESMMMGVDDLDHESMKHKLCEGTTSEAVLKILSPTVARTVTQKKEESLRSLMEKYNKTSYASSIRSSFDVGDLSQKLSYKMQTICDENNRRASITSESFTTKSDLRRYHLNIPSEEKQQSFGYKQLKPPQLVPRLIFGAASPAEVKHHKYTSSNLTNPSQLNFEKRRREQTAKKFVYDASSEYSLSPPASSRITPREASRYRYATTKNFNN